MQFSSKVVDIPVFTQRLIPMVLFVQKTIEIPRFVDAVADVPVVWPMSLLCGPADSQVLLWRRQPRSQFCNSSYSCLDKGRSHACCVQRQMPSGSACRKLRCLAVAVLAVWR